MKKKTSKKAVQKQFPTWGWIVVAVAVLAIIVVVVLQKPQSTAATLSTATAVNQAAQSPQSTGAPLPAEITIGDAAARRSAGAFILDVREPSEWEQFHIPGATLIPLGDLPNRLSEVPKDREVVVVCRTGHRSAQGRDILLQAGFSQVTSMAGGVTAWQEQGLPIATGK